ncbi:MAG: LacI family DNA-binding transcriptional regulator [Phycisphaerales bacterium]
MASLKDVSNIAGVSISTVSHILSGRESRYSNETQRLVRLAAEEANYRPNLLARNLRRGQTKTIGLLVSQFYNEVVGLEMLCAEKGYSLQIGAHHSNFHDIRKVIDGFFRMQVDGLLVFNPDMSDSIIAQVFGGKPTVVIDDLQHRGVDSFVEDIEGAIRLAISTFLKLGHKSIGMVGSISGKIPCHHREKWFREVMKTNGLTVKNNWLLPLNNDTEKNPWERGYVTIKEYLKKWKSLDFLPTALIANNSEIAVGVVRALIDCGIRVPQDVSIIGLMDQSIGQYAPVKITGIDTKYRQIAIEAMDLLIERLDKKEVSKEYYTKIYKPELFERESCSPPVR